MEGTHSNSSRPWLRSVPLIVTASVFLAVFWIGAGNAQAARVHKLLVTETLPGTKTPFSVSVNQLTQRHAKHHRKHRQKHNSAKRHGRGKAGRR